MTTQHAKRRDIGSRISQIASQYGLELAVSGGKFDDLRQAIGSNGYWSENSFISKPSRLLVHLKREGEGVAAALSQNDLNGNFAYANTAHRSVGALMVRILGIIREPDGALRPHEECEWLLWYCFYPKLRYGSSGQLFDGFQPQDGTFTYMRQVQPYIAAGLISLHPADMQIMATDGTPLFSYGAATEGLHQLIHYRPIDRPNGEYAPLALIPVYDGTSQASLLQMGLDIGSAYKRASQAQVVTDTKEEPAEVLVEGGPLPEVPVAEELIGISEDVYRQINNALQSGKRHLLFYGPPGTGKTTLAIHVATTISEQWKLITGSADWTSQDIIGGYHPLAGGALQFMPGVLLEHFDKPFVFDELNRCDIDKVIGPLFTVLSGQSTTLPYLTDPSNPASARIAILPHGLASLPESYAPTSKWQLIATINSMDKASLYQMSYALTRRFAWIYVDVPKDPKAFVREVIARQTQADQVDPAVPVPLGDLWQAINTVRQIGAAPILDIMKVIQANDPDFSFFTAIGTPEAADPYLDGFYLFLLPMLDGVLRDQAERVADAINAALGITADQRGDSLKNRVIGLAI